MLDQGLELNVQKTCLEWIRNGWLQSAHDCSEGGLAVALAESCFTGPGQSLGVSVNLDSSLRKDALAFGESQSRILVSFAPDNEENLMASAKQADVQFAVLGTVGGDQVDISINSETYIRQDVARLKEIWEQALERYASRLA